MANSSNIDFKQIGFCLLALTAGIAIGAFAIAPAIEKAKAKKLSKEAEGKPPLKKVV